jgi:hypothetical protein
VPLHLLADAKKDGALNVLVQAEPPSLKPGTTQNGPTQLIAGNIYEGLLRYDDKLSSLPSLATSWTVNKEGTLYTFKLKPNVTWHDGKPFTSADVGFSADVFLRKARARFRANLEAVESIRAIDPLTVEFKLKHPGGPYHGRSGPAAPIAGVPHRRPADGGRHARLRRLGRHPAAASPGPVHGQCGCASLAGRAGGRARQPLRRHHCVGIAGLGTLGLACAEALRAIGYQVRGWSRNPRPESATGVATYHGPGQLGSFLAGCDTVVFLLPLTPETRGCPPVPRSKRDNHVTQYLSALDCLMRSRDLVELEAGANRMH